MSHQLDLGVGDVHVPGPMNRDRKYAAGEPAALALVFDTQGRVLTISRPEPPHEQAIPGGHVDEGETPEEAAARELREECGITATSLTKAGQLKSPDGRDVHVFHATAWAGLPYAAELGTKCQWLSADDLLKQSKTFAASVREMMGWGALGANGKRTMSVLPTKTRNSLPTGEFALPAQRKFPIHDAAHVRDAVSRLEGMHNSGKISPADYHEARGRIAKAAKKFGIESEYNKREELSTRPQFEAVIDHPQHGRVEIRHMSADGSQSIERYTDGSYCLRDVRPITMGDAVDPASLGITLIGPKVWKDGEPAKLVWIKLAEVGAWKGHVAGAFKLTPQTFSEIVKNFETRGLPVAFDHEHCSEQDATEGSIPVTGAPAQGWIHRLASRGMDGLWGLTHWLDYARDGIKAGNFAFVSPAIRFNASDQVTGECVGARLTSSAITNSPFLTHLGSLVAAKDGHPPHGNTGTNHPVPEGGSEPNANLLGKAVMTQSGGKTYAYGSHEFMPKIKACLGLPDLSTSAQCGASMTALRQLHAVAGDDGMYEGVNCGEYVNRLRDAMNVPMHSTVEDIFDAVDGMIGAAISEHEARMHPGQPAAAAAHLDDGDGGEGGGDEGDGGDEMKLKAATAAKEAALAAEEKDKAMADTNTPTNEMVLKLTDEAKKAETTVATLTLQAKEKDSVILAKDGEIKTLKDETVALKDQLLKLGEAEIDRRVDEAFGYYAEKKNLSDKDKKMMRICCKADRPAFDDLYPTPKMPDGAPAQPFMLRSIPKDKTVPLSTDAGGNPPALPGENSAALSIVQLALKIQKEDKCTIEEAQNKAAGLRAKGAA